MANMKHALLSASGASRWLACTPSARLEETLPKKSSSYADEGTAAHDLCEIMARYFLGEIKRAEMNKGHAKLKRTMRNTTALKCWNAPKTTANLLPRR